MRVLGLDFGEKRIGVAISDPLSITAQPLPYISYNPKFLEELKLIMSDYDIGLIVVGLPLSREGKDTQTTVKVRQFGAKLEQHLGKDIVFQDERYSTKAVERVLIEADVSRKKRKEVIDSQAAVFILQGYMDKQKHSSKS